MEQLSVPTPSSLPRALIDVLRMQEPLCKLCEKSAKEKRVEWQGKKKAREAEQTEAESTEVLPKLLEIPQSKVSLKMRERKERMERTKRQEAKGAREVEVRGMRSLTQKFLGVHTMTS